MKVNIIYYYGVVLVFVDGSRGSFLNVFVIMIFFEFYRVIVYYIFWGRYVRKFYVSDIFWEKVIYVNYVFFDFKEDGIVVFYDIYVDFFNFEVMKEYKRKYLVVKVFILVGGWIFSKYFLVVVVDLVKR